MKKTILLTLALGLFTTFSPAVPKKTEEAKPAAEAKKATKEEAKPAAKAAAKEEAKPAAKKATPKSKQKPEEMSAEDTALLAGAKKQVDALTPTQKTKLMALANSGDIKALTAVDGVGEAKAKAIVAERPFTNGEELIMVDGVGEGTFGNILTFIKGGQDKAEPKKEDKKEEKKAEPKTEKKEAPKAEKKEAPKTEKKKAA